MTSTIQPPRAPSGEFELKSSIDGPRSAWSRTAVVLCAILVPQMIVYSPSLFGGKIALPVSLLYDLVPGNRPPPDDANGALWDPVASYEPYRHFVSRELHAGRMPLWNPSIFCGAPVFTNSLSPFQCLYYISPDPKQLAWLWLLKGLVAGVGAFLFFRRVTRVRFWPAVFGAALYPLTFFFVLWQYFVIGSSCTWLPLLLVCTDATVRRPLGWGLVGVALTTTAFYLEGLGAIWPHMNLAAVLYALWRTGRVYGWPGCISLRAAGSLCAVGCGLALGGMLAAPQNLPAADYLQSSHRLASRAQGQVEQPPSGWMGTEELIFPHHFGNMSPASKYLWTFGNQLEGAAGGYTGLLTLLVLAPLAFCDRSRRAENMFWLGIGVFGFTYHLDIPYYREIFGVFPFTVFRNNRFTCYTGWATVVLAVTGVETLLTATPRWRMWFWGAVAVAFAAAAHATLCLVEIPADLAERQMEVAAEWFRREYAWELIVGVTALGAWYGIRRTNRARSRFVAVACGLTIVELIINAWGVNPQCDRAYYYPETPIASALRQMPPGRVSLALHLRPNVPVMYGLRDIRGYDGVDPERIVKLFRAVDPAWSLANMHAPTHAFEPPESPVMDMLNLRYVFRNWPVTAGARVVAMDQAGWVEERSTALPRAWVPQRVESVADDEQCLERLRQPDFDPRRVAYVVGTNGVTQSDPDSAGAKVESSDTAEITDEHPRSVVIAARMRTAGVLILADSWDRGWKVYVDGREAPVLRVNFLLRGVAVPAGEHTVDFRFEPASFIWGMRMCVTSAVLQLGWMALLVRRRRNVTG